MTILVQGIVVGNYGFMRRFEVESCHIVVIAVPGDIPRHAAGYRPFASSVYMKPVPEFARRAASNNVSRRCSSSSYCNDNTCRATLQIYFAEGSHRLKFRCPLSVSVTSRVRCGCSRHSRTSHRFGRCNGLFDSVQCRVQVCESCTEPGSFDVLPECHKRRVLLHSSVFPGRFMFIALHFL